MPEPGYEPGQSVLTTGIKDQKKQKLFFFNPTGSVLHNLGRDLTSALSCLWGTKMDAFGQPSA